MRGKTLRRSYQKKGAKAPIHMVSAFAARQRLVLGQVKVVEKSNEIVAIPKLLAMMAIEGAIVTIDARYAKRTGLSARGSLSKSWIRSPITSSPSKAIKAHFARMSRFSRPSRKRTDSRIQKSAGMKRATAITAASKLEPTPRSMMLYQPPENLTPGGIPKASQT
jgi:predicted transposase YbfD/YdcC